MATDADLKTTFTKHHAYWRAIKGIVHDQLRGREKTLRLEYAGRVPFELLQNALDRCVEHVWIGCTDDALIVANDAESALSIDPDFVHGASTHEKSKMSDFHAICSVGTSNKSPDQDYGNKGVGFRSVFSLSDRVQVWTVHPESGWWGFELHRELTADLWRARVVDSVVAEGCGLYIERGSECPLSDTEIRPSYAFPLPLRSADLPGVDLPARNWKTVVVVPLDSKGANSLKKAMDSLSSMHLDFVRLPRILETLGTSCSALLRWLATPIPGIRSVLAGHGALDRGSQSLDLQGQS